MSYKRTIERRKRLRRLYNATKDRYGAGAYYDEQKHRIIRYSCNLSRIRRAGNKLIRCRMKRIDHVVNGASYKKMYDYWWNVL